MGNIGYGKRTGLFMKLIKLIFGLSGIFSFWACSPPPEDDPLKCGLYISFDMPNNVDSIHVMILKNDSILHSFKDTISCSKCYENSVWVNMDNSDLKKNWGYGEYYIKEIAYCKGKITEFTPIPLVLKNNFIGLINVGYIKYATDMYSPLEVVSNDCGIDSTYQVYVQNDDFCYD